MSLAGRIYLAVNKGFLDRIDNYENYTSNPVCFSILITVFCTSSTPSLWGDPFVACRPDFSNILVCIIH
jgi:hypothetical protein